MTEEEDDENNDDPKIVKSRMNGFSRGKLEAGRNGLGLCTARVESKSCCCVFQGLARRSRGVEGVLYPDHVRLISLVSSLPRASTNALIIHTSSLEYQRCL